MGLYICKCCILEIGRQSGSSFESGGGGDRERKSDKMFENEKKQSSQTMTSFIS